MFQGGRNRYDNNCIAKRFQFQRSPDLKMHKLLFDSSGSDKLQKTKFWLIFFLNMYRLRCQMQNLIRAFYSKNRVKVSLSFGEILTLHIKAKKFHDKQTAAKNRHFEIRDEKG